MLLRIFQCPIDSMGNMIVIPIHDLRFFEDLGELLMAPFLLDLLISCNDVVCCTAAEANHL
ncbi:MAG: hypothetical protein K0Q94_382 [Paenibacillus sp.]|jgi:hypothetical protein|nr:hypothetical protein [Paenibacillus sp.]